MRKYLTKLHSKPDHHKRRFAFLASSTVTLFIFGVWSLSTFGIDGGKVAENDNALAVSSGTESSEIGPLESFRMNVAASLEALRYSFGELKSGFESVDFETEYKNMRDGALDTYGQ